MSKENSQRLTVFWIFFTFAIWIFAFRGFLTSKFELTSDALSYYDHVKFFIENLGRGVFPLWDPYWYNGSPNDFFLRRIGPLNPFYAVVLLFKTVGIPYVLSYLWFLAGYYWSGMIAFYLLAMRIYQNRFIAYAGYLILLFSALGTRLFDSYMMFVTVPLIWFFYFLTAFTQTPRKHFFLGMTLSFMILMGTYIPLFFLIILGLFSLLFLLLYFDRVPGIFRAYIGFFKKNKILVLLSFLVLVLSFFPIISFFHDSTRGQVVLPLRHGDAAAGQVLTVPHQTLDWGVVEDLMFSYYFSDLRLYKLAVVYVPFFSVILIVLGLIGRINRRAVFMLLLGVVLFCCIVPYGLPFFNFFYKHVFFLKLFRNLHFFIWFFFIPLFVLLVLEHWKMFTETALAGNRRKWFLLFYVLCVHLIILVFVWWRKDAILSTYLMISLSFIFWSLLVLRCLRANGWGFILLTLTVLVQPMEVYHYFSLEETVPHTKRYFYDFSFSSLKLKDTALITPEDVPADKPALYYASGDYNFVYQNVSNYALRKYLLNKFILVDHLEPVDRGQMEASLLERIFLADANAAIIFNDGLRPKDPGDDAGPFDPDPPPNAQRIDGVSEAFKVLAFDANHVRLTIDMPYKKFLIYNDNYDPYWRVSINHHRARLYEVNGAFKGTWVPAGRSVVEFSYGCWWQYVMNVLPLVFALIILGGIIWYARLSQTEAEADKC